MINKENEHHLMSILNLLSELEVVVAESQEKLYLANSETLLKLI